MGARMCSNCMELFEFDDNDIRPFVYHECEDGTMMAHRNPNALGKKTSHTYYPKHEPKSNKKTLWSEYL